MAVVVGVVTEDGVDGVELLLLLTDVATVGDEEAL